MLSHSEAIKVAHSYLPDSYTAKWNGACDWLGVYDEQDVEITNLVPNDMGSEAEVRNWAIGVAAGLAASARRPKIGDRLRVKKISLEEFAKIYPDKDAPHRPAAVFIPAELDSIRPEIIRHWDAMIYKLRKNSHKGSIQEWDLEAAFEKLEEEVKELRQAIDEGSPVEIIMESADVSNMALILAAIGLKKVHNA